MYCKINRYYSDNDIMNQQFNNQAFSLYEMTRWFVYSNLIVKKSFVEKKRTFIEKIFMKNEVV